MQSKYAGFPVFIHSTSSFSWFTMPFDGIHHLGILVYRTQNIFENCVTHFSPTSLAILFQFSLQVSFLPNL